ncbi:MAG: hypothetical protein AB8E15_01965 [Bdellovibrionales bacterium]
MKNIILIVGFLSFTLVSFATERVGFLKISDGREVLVEAISQKTLYIFDKDKNGESACHGPCLITWPALVLETGEGITEPFSVLLRDDNVLQLQLDDKPLYFFAGDTLPGQMNGDGLGGTWHIITRE